MSFLEQMGKKISDVSQGVVQQTKNFSDATRINNAISEKKKTMSKLMWEMGQDYYIKHKKDISCEEQEYIDQINAIFKEVLQLQKELEKHKEMDTCRSCGTLLEEGTLFCTNCGTPVANEGEEVGDEKESDSNGRICPACGEEIDDDSYFCCYCGEDLCRPGNRGSRGN